MKSSGRTAEMEREANHKLFAPLAQRRYLNLWLANGFSHFGTWMHSLAAAWLMATLTDSPFLIAAVQTASALPVALIVLPAGLLADLVPRPLYLTLTHSWMCAIALTIAVVQSCGAMQAELLLLLSAALALGYGLTMPAWQAVSADLVSRQQVPAAAALNGMSFNFARTFAPVAGAIIYKTWGAASVFAVNCASFSSLIFVYASWAFSTRGRSSANKRRTQTISRAYREILANTAFRALITHTFFVFLTASVFWALLPSIVLQAEKQSGAATLGVSMGIAGIGAIAATSLLPTIRRKVSVSATLSAYAVCGALGLVGLATVDLGALFMVSSFLVGFAWGGQVAVLNARAQVALQSDKRARAISMNLMAMYSGIAVGSSLWGMISARYGLEVAVTLAGLAWLFAATSAPWKKYLENWA